MVLKKFSVLLIISLIFSIGTVSAGLFGYDNGECDLFYITCPEGYSNAGELNYNDSIFISTNSYERPYHSIHIYPIGECFKTNFTNFDEEGIVVEYTVDEGNFKAYKTVKDYDDNVTYAFYNTGSYNYELQLAHDGVSYTDNQFNEDVDLLRNVAYSIVRK